MAELYCYWPRSWHLDMWEPWDHGSGEHDDVTCPWIEDVNNVRGIWEQLAWTDCEEEFTRAIEEVGDKRWRGGLCSRDVEQWQAVLCDVKESSARKV